MANFGYLNSSVKELELELEKEGFDQSHLNFTYEEVLLIIGKKW